MLKAPFIYDDYCSIVENKDLWKISNIKSRLIYRIKESACSRNGPTRPIAFLTFTTDYYFWKLNPLGYHCFNLLLHIGVVLLIFVLTRKIFFYLYGNENILLALTTALFFALHPINTDVVSYITGGRSEGLAVLFYLSTLLFFVKTFEKSKKFFPLALTSYFLALFSKEITVTLPATLLLFDYLFLSHLEFKKVAEKKYYHLGLWIMMISWLLFRHFYFGKIGFLYLDINQYWTPLSYFSTQLSVTLKYVQLLFIPIGQSLDHYVSRTKSIIEFKNLFSLILWIEIFLFFSFIAKKMIAANKTENPLLKTGSSFYKLILFSFLWFIITLSPTSSFVPTYDAMVERRLYLPGWGFTLGILALYLWLFGVNLREPICSTRYKKMMFFLTLHILLLGIMTLNRNKLYQTPKLLYEEAIKLYPDHFRAYINLGAEHENQKDYDNAFQLYKKAIELNPHNILGNSNHAHQNIKSIYFRIDQNKAVQHLEEIIKLNPKPIDEYILLGDLYSNMKNYPKALEAYQKAIELAPKFISPHQKIFNIYLLTENYQAAQFVLEDAVKLDPDNLSLRFNLGSIYQIQKNYKKAFNEFKVALRISPNDSLVKHQMALIEKWTDQP